MALTSETLKKWARGVTSKATPEGNPEDVDLDEDMDLDDEDLDDEDLEEGERNAVWAGEVEPEEVTPEMAEDLMEWLEEHEPDIYEAVVQVALAEESGDAQMMDDAMTVMEGADQLLNPEYPPLTSGQRKKAGANIAKHIREKGRPKAGTSDWKQAVAIGLSEARRGKGH